MNTRFANSVNPWTGEKMTKTNKPMRLIDPSELEICNDPLPAPSHTPTAHNPFPNVRRHVLQGD